MYQTMRDAFQKSLPVFFGYLFLGIAFAITMCDAGFAPGWAILSSVIIYAGSMQFAMVGLLRAGTGLGTIAVMTLLINSRHLFYGLSFVEAFKKMGRRYLYMIFSLTDETYSVLCTMDQPEDAKTSQSMFWVALFDQCYWILGTIIGVILGKALPFDTTGIDFSMTALFVTIFIDQWRSSKNHTPALIAILSGIFYLCVLGQDQFLLPTIGTTVCILFLAKKKIQTTLKEENR